MATATYPYGKYFSSASVTTGSTTFNNLFNTGMTSSRLWSPLVDIVISSLIVQQPNGGYKFGSALPTSIITNNTGDTISDLYRLYSDTTNTGDTTFIVARFTFVNVNNQTYSSGIEVVLGADHGFELTGTTISNEINRITNAVDIALGSNTAKEAYLTDINLYAKFAFAHKKASLSSNFIALYNPSSTAQLLTADAGYMDFSLTKGVTSTRSFTINLTKTTANIVATVLSRTLKNSYAISTSTSYTIVPTFLEDRKATDYHKGQIGTSIVVTPTNHQAYMGDNAITVIDKIITDNTKSGAILKSNTTSYQNLITSITDEGTSITSCKYTIGQWQADGYAFYRDSAHSTTVAQNSTFNANTTSTLTIYPLSTAQRCFETMYLCLYDYNADDADGEQISYQLGGSDYINRYYTPPTDILNYTAETTVHDQTMYTYGLNQDKTNVNYGTSNYYPLTGVTNVKPDVYFPKIATFQFTSNGEDLPTKLDGFVTCSFENRVRSDSVLYDTSVRYHLSKNSESKSIEYGQKALVAQNIYRRNSIIYLGVEKNTLDFIEGITFTDAPVGWQDEISGINYYEPIAYADKLSTMNDLADRLTCFHGRAAYYYLNNTSYRYLNSLKNWFLTQLWTSGCNFYARYNTYTDTSKPVRYRSISINGTVYSEINWPMRYYNYPTWTSATATSFDYHSGLVIKYKQGMVSSWDSYAPDLVIFNSVNETTWNNAINSTQSVSSGVYFLVKYNGYLRYTGGGTYPFTTIASNSATVWNRDRRAIGNVEYRSSGITNFTPNDILVGWIYDTTGNFDDSIGQGYDGHHNINGNGNGIATNNWLYRESYE